MQQFISMNLVEYGSDPTSLHILLKNLTVRIQSEKVFYIGSSTIWSCSSFILAILVILVILVILAILVFLAILVIL